MPALAVTAFALSWWLACYLVGRDPRRPVLRWAAAALVAYAVGIAAWTVAPGSPTAQLLLCLPALGWAGSAVALLPLTPAERRHVDRGWLVLAVLFTAIVTLVPGAVRLVALAPLAGGLALLLRVRGQVAPPRLPLAIAAVALLYGAGLAALLVRDGFGAPDLALASLGLDLLVFGYLTAVAHAVDAGERLRPDLRRSFAAAAVALLIAGGPAALTMFLVPWSPTVAVVQFTLVAAAMTAAGLDGRLRRLLDRVALVGDGRLRTERAALFLDADALLRRRAARRLAAIGEPEFLRLTRRALDDFGDLDRLARSPLTELPQVQRRMAGREQDQPRARARELRAVLREAVAALRPPGAFGTTQEWRYYNALQFGRVLGLNPYARRPRTDGLSLEARLAVDWIRRHVRRDTLRQWQREAAMLVAGRLWAEVAAREEITTRSD